MSKLIIIERHAYNLVTVQDLDTGEITVQRIDDTTITDN